MQIISTELARKFAEEWVSAWNAHDIDRILSHYSDNFTIETPMASKLLPQSNGIVEGKQAVRIYWTLGLQRIPGLKFEILDILMGMNGLSVYYYNTATRKKAVEVMLFNDELKVHKAVVHYSE